MVEIAIRRVASSNFMTALVGRKGRPRSGLTDVVISPTSADLTDDHLLRSAASMWSSVAQLSHTMVLLVQPTGREPRNVSLHEFYRTFSAGQAGVFLAPDTRVHLDATEEPWADSVSGFFGKSEHADANGLRPIETVLLPPLPGHLTFSELQLATAWYRGVFEQLGIEIPTAAATPVLRSDVGTDRQTQTTVSLTANIIQARQDGVKLLIRGERAHPLASPTARRFGRFMAAQVSRSPTWRQGWRNK